MDSISNILRPYKDIVGSVASFLTIAQFFSGTFICLDIRKRGSTKGISSTPFVGGIMVGLAMIKYGLLLHDQVTLNVNAAAIILNTAYCVVYYYYSRNKWEEFLKPLSISMAVVAVLWGYCEWESASVLEFRYGMIVTILMLGLLGTPLIDVKGIIEKKDASKIPFVLTFMATLVTFSWFLYAIILQNNFMIVQNVIGFLLCSVQLILIFLYPGKPSKGVKKKTN